MYLELIVKTIFMYFIVLLIYRLVKKNKISDFNTIELVIIVIISTLISLSLESNNIIVYIIPILVLIVLQLLLNYGIVNSEKIRRLISGKPIVIIKNGKLNFTEMSKLKYSLDDLLSGLRMSGVKSIEEVKYAILESNGNLSIFKDNKAYPLPLILDGVIDYEVLKEIKKDYDWLIGILRKKNLELSEVFYAFYTEGKTFVIKKSELL